MSSIRFNISKDNLIIVLEFKLKGRAEQRVLNMEMMDE